MSELPPHPKAVFTEEELERLRSVVYPSLPSFREEDWSIASSDVRALMAGVRDRSEEEHAAYQSYWDEHHGGRVPWAVMRPILADRHLTGPWAAAFVRAAAKGGDGFIRKDAFKLFFDIFEQHHAGYALSWDEFVAQADVDHDGKVSVEEALDWIQNQEAK